MRKILSLLIAIAVLFTVVPVYALDMSDLTGAQNEQELREAVRGDELWVKNFPGGLFNFVGTQYVVNESQKYLEIAIARQGGTEGAVSVDFKAIDISAEYGEDYVIRLYENAAQSELAKNQKAMPLVQTMQEGATLNISKPESTPTVQEEVYSNVPQTIITGEESMPDDEFKSGYTDSLPEQEIQPYLDLDPKIVQLGEQPSSKSLRKLKEVALNKESDRPDWKEVNLDTIEQLKEEYDRFFYNIPGTETTIEFQDGEYIKYLYIVPINDAISESEEQILFALTNPEGGAVRGEFYMAYANITDDEEVEASVFELPEEGVLVKDGQASVVVRRFGGIWQYASVYIGTEGGTAIAGCDYLPGLQEILFTPGMTEQTVVVDILENSARDQYREFTIALDRENGNVNPEKAETRVTVPAGENGVRLLAATEVNTPQYLQPIIYDNRGVEKISQYGYSPQKGQWAVVAQDFLAGNKAGTAYADGNEIRLRANGGSAYAMAKNVKLYGVDWVNYAVGNTGCGHHWTERLWYTLWVKEVPKSEHNFNTTFGVVSPSRNAGELWKESGNFGRKGVTLNIDENLWNTSSLGFGTWAAGQNQSTADIGWLRLNLKQYTLQVKNDEANVPKFSVTEYDLEDQKLEKIRTLQSAQPGTMTIKAVYSNVGNGKSFTPKPESTGVYRSDMIEFSVAYANNIIGQNSTYVGFEVYVGNGKWERYSGTTLKLDSDFFAKSGMLNAVRGGTIQVRPVFHHNDAKLTIKADMVNGYITGLGEKVKEKTLSGLKKGDIIHAAALNYHTARTPSWSANNGAKLVSTDETGANTSVKYEISALNDQLKVSFLNPTLIVESDPATYRHNITNPQFRIDGVLYTDVEKLAEDMEAVFAANEDDDPDNDQNPIISISFAYDYNEAYPDPNDIFKNEFGAPAEAILTVYQSDGTVRGLYSSDKTKQTPASCTVTANNGSYAYVGRLKELGWQSGDYATIIVYGSKTNTDGFRMSTRENAIDFLVNSGNSVTVKTPKDTFFAGNVYQPVILTGANPLENYEMTSFTVPGYTTNWMDFSGDLDGDGQESDDEYEKLKLKMKAYGMELDEIRANPNNRSYDELFYGNFFNYAPKFFNPSRIYYSFEKMPQESSGLSAWVKIYEKYRTVLDPDTQSDDLPVKGATVILGNKSYVTDERGLITASDTSFRKGLNYSARVLYKGYEFYTYVQPAKTVIHVFDTSDIMRPVDFRADYTADDSESPEKISLDKDRTLLPVRSGETRFQFRVDSGKEGIRANDSIIRIYQTNQDGYRTDVKYETRTGQPDGGIFSHAMNLLREGIKPGYRMTIAPLFIENGEIKREYPEVDVGLTFSMNLSAVSVLGSFDTPLSPAVEFIGKMNNSFDLGMDIDIDDMLEPGTRVDSDGVRHNTKSISFGFTKEFEKKFGDQAEPEEDDEPKTPIYHLKEAFKGQAQAIASQNPIAKAIMDEVTGEGEERGSGGGTFNFTFETSLTITIEEGQIQKDGLYVADGYHYFSSMVLMAKGDADFGAKYTYVTPIGIPVFATLDITGSATAILAIEANDDERYVDKYRFDAQGSIPLNAEDYSIFTKFFITPSITIGAGAGMDYLKAWIEGTATAEFQFTAPIFGENAKSSGDGGLTISAAVGIKILFIQKKWTIYQSKRYELFSYGNMGQAMVMAMNDPYTNYLYRTVDPVNESEIMPRDYLENQSQWLGGEKEYSMLRSAFSTMSVGQNAEEELIRGAYPYPQTKIVPFGDKVLVLFIGDPGEDERDTRNRAQLFYSIYDGSDWSVPQALDTDGTWDEAPDAFVVEDKILITWSDAHRVFTETDDAKTTLQAMNISGKWFDPVQSAFGEEFAITKETVVDEKFADCNPMISYDPLSGRLMVYFMKLDYEDQKYDYDNTAITDPSATKNTTDDGESSAMYGDLVNAYSLIAYRYAIKQEDGTFLWNTTYEAGEGYPAYFEHLYGQRFLDLAVEVDVEETEVLRDPPNATVDDPDIEVPAGYRKGITGTEQVVTALANKINDPLITESDLISYNGLALHAYVMDSDSSKSTVGDQELYLQIYNYELNEFHHPIRLTSNHVQDAKPQFIRTKGITYLYWLSGGDIVFMDISSLVKYNLRKVEVEVGGITRSIYIVDKSHTGINGFIHTAVESRQDYPIEDFTIETNADSQFLLYTDYVIAYKNGLKPGDPGTENPENLIKEKQIFAAWSEPQLEIRDEQLFDAYADTGEYTFAYATGKASGTYPEKITVQEAVYNGDELVFETGTNIIDYTRVPDVNGYKGAVEAGDPVIARQYAHSEGYPWSKPVQITHETGANYSDISFIVNENGSIRAVYVKYQQVLDDNNTFVEDTGDRIFASTNFTFDNTLETDVIRFSDEFPKAGDTLNFSTSLTNTGIQPVTGLTCSAYLKQDGEETAVGEEMLILDAEQNDRILGGNSIEMNGSFALPEAFTKLVVGFRVLDESGSLLLQQEREVKAEAALNITVLNGYLKSENMAGLSLFARNNGNADFNGTLKIMEKKDGTILQTIDLVVEASDSKSLDVDLPIDESMFGMVKKAEDNSCYDQIELVLTAGETSTNTAIMRVADKETVDKIENVKAFSLNRQSLELQPGTMYLVKATTELVEPADQDMADPLEIVWRTSNPNVASILPDGTIVALAEGSAVITAALAPVNNTTATLSDGTFTDVDTRYKLPANMILKRTVSVTVDSIDDDDGGDSAAGSVDTEADKKPLEPEMDEDSVTIKITPVMEGRTSIATPGENVITEALQKLTEGNRRKLTISAAVDENAEGSKLILTANVINTIAQSSTTSVAFESPLGNMVLEGAALHMLQDLANQPDEAQEITIGITRVDAADIPEDLKEQIGNRPVFDFSIMIGNRRLGELTTEPIPLTLELEGMTPEQTSGSDNQTAGVYIAENGEYKFLPLSAMVNGRLIIKTTHNSYYTGVYNKVHFSDVSGWSKEHIEFLAARDIVNGVGDSQFKPLDSITRAEFVKIMARVADAEALPIRKTSFTDVDPNAWYAPYVEWAYTNGLVNGVGSGRFAPDENITRQDMAVLIARLADKLGFTLPELTEEMAFADRGNISGYAQQSVKAVQQAGIINGWPGAVFAPKEQATRGECAKMVAVLIRLIVSE